jgi:hypothetical protein
LGLIDLDTPPDLLRFHGVPRRLLARCEIKIAKGRDCGIPQAGVSRRVPSDEGAGPRRL